MLPRRRIVYSSLQWRLASNPLWLSVSERQDPAREKPGLSILAYSNSSAASGYYPCTINVSRIEMNADLYACQALHNPLGSN